jgi:type IX secretion system PorP/SprF family membrane protein
MKKIIIILIATLSVTSAFAQQEQMYSHYDFNSLALNPAYAGTNRTLNAMALRRVQWTDWPGAPVYNNLAVHAPINRDFAVGLNIQNGTLGTFQQTAPLSETHVGLNLAYHKSITKDWRVAVGLRLGLFNYNLQLSKLMLDNSNDASFKNDYSINAPLSGFGIYAYNKNSFFAVSAPRIVFVKDDIQNQVNLAYATQVHYYLIGGMVFDVSPMVKIKPTTQIKMTNGVPTQIDLNVHAIYDNKMSLGAFYRSEADLGLMFNYSISDNFKVLYSYDYNLKRFDNSRMGSHEFGVLYQIPTFEKGKMPVPRFF